MLTIYTAPGCYPGLEDKRFSALYDSIYRLGNDIHGIEKINQIIIYRTEKRKIGQLFYRMKTLPLPSVSIDIYLDIIPFFINIHLNIIQLS